eukprot:gene9252-6687_t
MEPDGDTGEAARERKLALAKKLLKKKRRSRGKKTPSSSPAASPLGKATTPSPSTAPSPLGKARTFLSEVNTTEVKETERGGEVAINGRRIVPEGVEAADADAAAAVEQKPKPKQETPAPPTQKELLSFIQAKEARDRTAFAAAVADWRSRPAPSPPPSPDQAPAPAAANADADVDADAEGATDKGEPPQFAAAAGDEDGGLAAGPAEEHANAWATRVFGAADKNGDGILTKSELKKYFKANTTDKEALVGKDFHWNTFWGEMDEDGDGTIDAAEFTSMAIKVARGHGDGGVMAAAAAAPPRTGGVRQPKLASELERQAAAVDGAVDGTDGWGEASGWATPPASADEGWGTPHRPPPTAAAAAAAAALEEPRDSSAVTASPQSPAAEGVAEPDSGTQAAAKEQRKLDREARKAVQAAKRAARQKLKAEEQVAAAAAAAAAAATAVQSAAPTMDGADVEVEAVADEGMTHHNDEGMTHHNDEGPTAAMVESLASSMANNTIPSSPSRSVASHASTTDGSPQAMQGLTEQALATHDPTELGSETVHLAMRVEHAQAELAGLNRDAEVFDALQKSREALSAKVTMVESEKARVEAENTFLKGALEHQVAVVGKLDSELSAEAGKISSLYSKLDTAAEYCASAVKQRNDAEKRAAKADAEAKQRWIIIEELQMRLELSAEHQAKAEHEHQEAVTALSAQVAKLVTLVAEKEGVAKGTPLDDDLAAAAEQADRLALGSTDPQQSRPVDHSRQATQRIAGDDVDDAGDGSDGGSGRGAWATLGSTDAELAMERTMTSELSNLVAALGPTASASTTGMAAATVGEDVVVDANASAGTAHSVTAAAAAAAAAAVNDAATRVAEVEMLLAEERSTTEKLRADFEALEKSAAASDANKERYERVTTAAAAAESTTVQDLEEVVSTQRQQLADITMTHRQQLADMETCMLEATVAHRTALAAARTNVADLKASTADCETMVQQLEGQIKTIRKEHKEKVATLRQANKDGQVAIAAAEAQITEKDGEIAQFQTQVEGLLADAAATAALRTQDKAALHDMESRMQLILSEAGKFAEAANDASIKDKEEITALKAAAAESAENVQAGKSDTVSALEDRVAMLETSLEQAANEMGDRADKMSALEADAEKAATDAVEQAERVASLRAQLEQATAEAISGADTIGRLQSDLEDVAETANARALLVSKLESDLEHAASVAGKEAEAAIDEMDAHLAEAAATIALRDDTISTLEMDLEQATLSVSDIGELKASLVAAIQSSNSEIEGLRTQVKELEGAVEAGILDKEQAAADAAATESGLEQRLLQTEALQNAEAAAAASERAERESLVATVADLEQQLLKLTAEAQQNEAVVASMAPQTPDRQQSPQTAGPTTTPDRLAALYGELKARYEKVRQKSSGYKRELAVAQKAKAAAEAAAAGAGRVTDEWRAKCDDAAARTADAAARIAALQAENNTLADDVAACKARTSEVEEHMASLVDASSMSHTFADAADTSSATAANEDAVEEKECRAAEQAAHLERQRASAEVAATKEEVARLQNGLTAATETGHKLQAIVEQQASQIRSRLKDLERAERAAGHDRERASATARQWAARNSTLQKELAASKAAKAQADAKLNKVRQAAEQQQSLNGGPSIPGTPVQKLQAELEASAQKVKSHEHEIEELRVRIAQSPATPSSAQSAGNVRRRPTTPRSASSQGMTPIRLQLRNSPFSGGKSPAAFDTGTDERRLSFMVDMCSAWKAYELR